MSEICNCPLGLPCDQTWEQMDEIPGLLAMRFCTRCEKSVHWASSDEQRRRLAGQGRAVAAELPLRRCAHSDRNERRQRPPMEI